VHGGYPPQIKTTPRGEGYNLPSESFSRKTFTLILNLLSVCSMQACCLDHVVARRGVVRQREDAILAWMS